MPLGSNPQQRAVENELRQLERKVDAMDGKLRAYLADRQNKPHPRHMELVEKIQQYRIPPAISTKSLENQLDNLQWKVYYHKKAWQQLWENAEAAYRQGRQISAGEPDSSASAEAEGEGGGTQASQSFHSYWSLQQKKLREIGERSSETLDAFENRIRKNYRQLAGAKGDDQEIVMTFDKEKKQCTLELRRKE